MGQPNSNSVFDEPQFRAGGFAGDSQDLPLSGSAPGSSKPLPVGQGAWDEPSLSGELVGERPEHIQTYGQWLSAGASRITLIESWGITLAIALVSGLWSVVGAVLSQIQGGSLFGLIVIVVFGPLAEEMLKASAALMTIEKWPYVFRSPVQIVFCCMAAAFGFAVLENMLYLHLYMPDPSAFIATWRWSVCVVLHVGCSTIAALGLVRIWKETMRNGVAPRVATGTPYFIAATAVHGAYNFIAVLANPIFARL